LTVSHMVQEVVGPMHSQQQHYLLLSSPTLQPLCRFVFFLVLPCLCNLFHSLASATAETMTASYPPFTLCASYHFVGSLLGNHL